MNTPLTPQELAELTGDWQAIGQLDSPPDHHSDGSVAEIIFWTVVFIASAVILNAMEILA